MGLTGSVKKFAIIILVVAALAAAGIFLFRHFVTNRIMDRGGMTNPDAGTEYAGDTDLVYVSWSQNHAVRQKCFDLQFYLYDGEPMLAGKFTDRAGDELRTSGSDGFSLPIPWPLEREQWDALDALLRQTELPEYRRPSSDSYDAVDSKLTVCRGKGGNEVTYNYGGGDADELESTVLGIAHDAYEKSLSIKENRNVSETARITDFYWDQAAASADESFCFRLGGGTMAFLQPKEGIFFSCKCYDENHERIVIGDLELSYDIASQYLERIARELRAHELKEYDSPKRYNSDAVSSCIIVKWEEGEEVFSNIYDGENAERMRELLTETAVDMRELQAALPIPEGGWRCECGKVNGNYRFCAECGKQRPA